MRRSTRSGGIRFAARNNSRIAYDPGTSAGASPDLPVAMMLHALLADHTEFSAVKEYLAGKYRVIVPDARGHGASPTLQNQWYSMAELAADVIAVLDAEEIPAAHLVGHELGGTVAFELARRHPERVNSLALIEPELGATLDADPDDEIRAARNDRRTGDRNAGDAAYKQLVDRSLDAFLNPRWGSDWRDSLTKPRIGAIRRHAAALAGILPAIDSYQLGRQDAAAITTPALLIVDQDAGLIELTVARRLANWLPRASLREMALSERGSGSYTAQEASTLAGVLLDFWSSRHEGNLDGGG